MISFLTPLATNGISYAYGFVFVGTNIAGALVTYFFLYESVSLSLENVDAMYGQPGLKPWTSRKWTPEGYVTRLQRDEDFFRQRAAYPHHDEDDGATAVPSGRPSRAAAGAAEDDMEKKRSDGSSGGGFGRESREEKVNRAV
jgi:SP family sugar:H+ symporter-like MFS transporter